MLPHLSPPPPPAHYARARANPSTSPITHIVVIVQENRTIDNLFNGFCASVTQCANTVTHDSYVGPPPGLPLTAVDLDYAGYNVPHEHTDFVTDYAYGAMNGFPTAPPSFPSNTTVAYVPGSETPEYRFMFQHDGILNDNVFAPNQGPSFPAHQYGIAGHAGGYDPIAVNGSRLDIAGNPGIDELDTTCEPNGMGGFGGIAPAVNLQQTYPGLPEINSKNCRDHATIFDLLPATLTWEYYSPGTAMPYWQPTQSIKHLYGSPNFHQGPGQIITDIQNGALRSLVFVTPTEPTSDHPGFMNTNTAGGAWVAGIVNAIGNSSYWNNTVIILYWDDFGGFFDHVKPPFATDPFLQGSGMNPNEYGFRLPYGVISAYARVGLVAHGVYGAASPLYCSTVDSLSFIENNFGLGTLGTEDVLNTGCTASMLDLTKSPDAFVPVPISASGPTRYRHRVH